MGCVGIFANIWNDGIDKQETNDNKTTQNYLVETYLGEAEVSVISIYPRHSLERKTESEIKVKPSSSRLNHDYQIIIETTCLFFGIVLVLMMFGPVMISFTNGLSMMKSRLAD